MQDYWHDPGLCWPVVRRTISDELLHLFLAYLDSSPFPGRLLWRHTFPNRQAYCSAVYRLRKAGLLVRRRRHGLVTLQIGPEAHRRQPRVWRPDRAWKRTWKGIWYVLVYDVPERQRAYRDVLREFLRRQRMGCLQKSVWVSAHDIRPEYRDLAVAAEIRDFAFLFEARTVLGRSALDVVDQAWDFDRLDRGHEWYCRSFEARHGEMLNGRENRAALEQFAREEMTAYLTVMDSDPLLPRELWPPTYLGPKVYALHRRIVADIAARL